MRPNEFVIFFVLGRKTRCVFTLYKLKDKTLFSRLYNVDNDGCGGFRSHEPKSLALNVRAKKRSKTTFNALEM